jgi:hypothetical protein
MDAKQLEDCFSSLCDDVLDFWQPLHEIKRINYEEIDSFTFYRDFVCKSVPVILQNAMESKEWLKIRQEWQNPENLIKKANQSENKEENKTEVEVTVDVTPFGLGDAVLELSDGEEIFIMPEERKMSMRRFFQALHDREHFDGVPYLSHQVRNVECSIFFL